MHLNVDFQGSVIYASLWTHEGIIQDRRDDLAMLGFTLLHLAVLSDQIPNDYWFKTELENQSFKLIDH